MIFQSLHWKNICDLVSKKCLLIFPHIKSKKLKSEIISNLFETQSELYFNSIGIETVSAQNDKEPDLFFVNENKSCEIKVTGIDHPFTNKCKWMGGKYSKRPSDYILIIWNYQKNKNTLFGEKPEHFNFLIAKCFVNQDEWKTIDSGNENYYATIFESRDLLSREHQFLIGNHDGQNFILCEFK